MPANNLIFLGADLQQKLDAMETKLRRARWAGYVANDLYRIAQRLHALGKQARSVRATSAFERVERRLLEKARIAVQELGFGIEVYRQPDPVGWPIVVVFPGDVSNTSDIHARFEQGIAVPPRP